MDTESREYRVGMGAAGPVFTASALAEAEATYESPPTDRAAASTMVLRELGPMNLRDLTAATARRMGWWSLLYADVDAVMEGERKKGRVALAADADDHRNRVWRAIAGFGEARAVGERSSSGFGDGLYRKRYLVTIIADTQTDGGDDWSASIGDGLGSEHCLWDIQEVESVKLAPVEHPETP